MFVHITVCGLNVHINVNVCNEQLIFGYFYAFPKIDERKSTFEMNCHYLLENGIYLDYNELSVSILLAKALSYETTSSYYYFIINSSSLDTWKSIVCGSVHW